MSLLVDAGSCQLPEIVGNLEHFKTESNMATENSPFIRDLPIRTFMSNGFPMIFPYLPMVRRVESARSS